MATLIFSQGQVRCVQLHTCEVGMYHACLGRTNWCFPKACTCASLACLVPTTKHLHDWCQSAARCRIYLQSLTLKHMKQTPVPLHTRRTTCFGGTFHQNVTTVLHWLLVALCTYLHFRLLVRSTWCTLAKWTRLEISSSIRLNRLTVLDDSAGSHLHLRTFKCPWKYESSCCLLNCYVIVTLIAWQQF